MKTLRLTQLMLVSGLLGVLPLPGVAARAAAGSFPDDPLGWPATTRECRPWTYNWWLGSAVDTNNLAQELRRYRNAGLGGIHIIPIYGAKGAKARYIECLSPSWMDMLQFTVKEAEREDMGVDMTTGTGWCFGGPNVTERQGG
jgi:alpha-L-rhamnosidase